jgi:hypothetical protein
MLLTKKAQQITKTKNINKSIQVWTRLHSDSFLPQYSLVTKQEKNWLWKHDESG